MKAMFSRFSLQQRPTFERVLSGSIALGVCGGIVMWTFDSLFRRGAFSTTLAVWSVLALWTMGIFKGDDRLTPFGWRVALTAPVVFLGLFVDLELAAGLGCVLAGAAYADPSASKSLLGGVAGALGAAWAIKVVPALMQALKGDLPSLAVCLFAGAAAGLLAALPWLALHARYFQFPLEQQLVDHPLLGDKAARAFHRCYQVFAQVPSGAARSEIFSVVDETAVKAVAQAQRFERSSAQLQQVNVEGMRTDLEALKQEVAQATDATTRQRLQDAASALSDTLEQLASVEAQTARARAELQVSLSELERAAVALESARGDPVALELVASRLKRRAPAMTLAAA